MLAYVTGSVDEELLRRNEYLVAENRILRAQIPGRVKLTDLRLLAGTQGSRKVKPRARKRKVARPKMRRRKAAKRALVACTDELYII